MNEQMVVDTVINEAGKAITNNEIDNRTTPQNEEQSIIEKLNGEINNGLVFFGEVTYETAQHIKEAGYELKDNNLQKVMPEQNTENQKVNQQENTEKQDENRTYKQAEKAFDIAVLCSTIVSTFEKNFNSENKMLNTKAVLTELAQKFNFDDVKSAVAVAILDRPTDVVNGKISMESRKWAWNQPLTDNIKPFNKSFGLLPLDIKSGFLDVFAKKVGTWEQSRQEKSPAVMSRKDIIGSKPKEHEAPSKTPQHDKSTPKKIDPSL